MTGRRPTDRPAQQAPSTERLARLVHRLVPNRYVAAIYALIAVLAAVSWMAYETPADGVATPADALNAVSYERYSGYTYGDIVGPGTPGTEHAGRRYKVQVVFTALHRDDARAFTVATQGGSKYSIGHQTVVVPGKLVTGPVIICTGHNRYAFIGSPAGQRTGFLGLIGPERNRIYPLHASDNALGSDLDTSLYGTDCVPPDRSILAAFTRSLRLSPLLTDVETTSFAPSPD